MDLEEDPAETKAASEEITDTDRGMKPVKVSVEEEEEDSEPEEEEYEEERVP